MPLKIVQTPEPLSENSLSQFEVRRPLLIGSDAARVLESELRDYCAGDITGRSFLIAGHRGAGKSTLVANAFLEVWTAFQTGKIKRRPLFVPLSGPALFLRQPAAPAADEEESDGGAPPEPPDAEDVEDAEDEDEPATATRTPRAPKTEAQLVLEQIVLGLHRAVAREFSRGYWEHSIAQHERPGGDKTDTRELSAQFDAELMDCPEPGRLSEFYRLAKLHPKGLLGSGPSGSAAEVLALSGITDAYKRISGEYAREDRRAARLTRELEHGLGRDDGAVKGIVDAALPLLVGGAAGVGVGATAGAGLQAVVAGIVAALGAVAVVKLSTKRTTTQSRVENFIFDLSLATLDRILPVCIERLWRAGLAPMFVVDELDKVDDLPKRMRDVVHHLKKLVAESAFFCFLADRQYFEDMLDQTSNRAYPQEYTYYSHRLFVAFQAGDFADYLEQKLQIVPAPADTASASTGAASDAPVPVATPPVAGAAGANAAPGRPDATGSSPETIAGAPAEQALAQAQAQAQARIQAQLAQGQREEDDKVVRDILIWAVRHRAQLHPLDLRRALRALADEDNRVTVSAGDVLRTAYRIDVTIQVLIEALLASTDVVQKIANEFESLRLIHDALYFITREWLQGKAELEINERGKRVFADYLEVRTGRTATGGDGQGHDEAHAQRTAAKKTAKKTRKKRGARQTPESDAAAARPAAIGLNGASLNTYDADFLFRLVRDLATALADKGAADKLIDDWQNPADAARRPKKPLADNVRSRLLLDPTQSVLVAKVRSKDGTDVIYEWRYDPSGRPRIPSVPAEVAAAPGTVESTAQTATPLDTPLGAETPTPGALPAWVQCWSDIQAFAARLNAAILAPEQLQQPLLGYRALARQFGLIPATPPWEEVEEAHRRLERGGQSADAVAEDTKRLLDFRNKVRSRESVIARALACAAAIGVASGANEPSERVVRGLTVLARSLRLTQRSEDDVAVSLAAVASDLQSLFPALRDDGQAPLPPASSEALAETLPTFIVAVQNALLVNEESWEPLLALAWNGALSRQISLYSGRGLSDPGVPELLHACRETGPSAILNVDPRQMTAAQWTTALVAAVKSPQTSKDIAVGEVPAWVGLTAMRELGLRSTSTGLQRAMKVLTRGGRLEAHSPLVDLFGPTITAASSAEAAVIVVRRPASTLTTSWLPPVPRYVALVATPAQIDALIAHEFPLGQLIRAPRQLVAVEVDEDPDEAIPDLDLSQGEPPVLHKISEAWKHLSSRPVFIYAHDPKSRPPGPFVVAPARFENLVTADYRQAR